MKQLPHPQQSHKGQAQQIQPEKDPPVHQLTHDCW